MTTDYLKAKGTSNGWGCVYVRIYEIPCWSSRRAVRRARRSDGEFPSSSPTARSRGSAPCWVGRALEWVGSLLILTWDYFCRIGNNDPILQLLYKYRVGDELMTDEWCTSGACAWRLIKEFKAPSKSNKLYLYLEKLNLIIQTGN